MPDPTLSAAIKEAYASAPSGVVVLHTLELKHPSFTTPIRVVNDHQDFSAKLENGEDADFIRFSFRFKLPDVMSTGMPEIEIEIDNITPEIIGYMDLATQSNELVEVTYRAYLNTDTSGPQNQPPLTLVLHDVQADVFSVRGRASFGDYGNRRFPGETYDADRFPGLVA